MSDLAPTLATCIVRRESAASKGQALSYPVLYRLSAIP